MSPARIRKVLGPRVPNDVAQQNRETYRRPKRLLTLSSILLGSSIFLPYWELKLNAPQYPDGLRVTAWVNRLRGDVQELEGLNHYIGLPSFSDGAVLERSVSIVGIITLAALLLAGHYVHSRWALCLAGPAVLFPFFFLADLQYWLWNYGHSLDPKAPLSHAVGEFTPPIFGTGTIAQFDTFAWPGWGFLMALTASFLAALGMVLHRRAYKPLALNKDVPNTATDVDKSVVKKKAAHTALCVTGLAIAVTVGADISANASPVQLENQSNDLQRLIDQAEPGAVIDLEAGVYTGGVSIDKPLTLRGTNWPVVDGHGVGSVIKIQAPNVTIEGLIIRNSGSRLDQEDAGISSNASPRIKIRANRFENVLFGMFLRRSNEAHILDNQIEGMDLFIARRGDGIRLWQSSDAIVEGNHLTGGRDAVFWFTDQITVRRNHVEDGRYGLHFMYSDEANVHENLLENNSVGAFLMYSTDLVVTSNTFKSNRGPSGYGLGIKDVDGLTAQQNWFVGNRSGLYVDNSPSKVGESHTITHNVFAFNNVGALLGSTVARNTFTQNAFIDNGEHVSSDGTGNLQANNWSKDDIGNYWSDYSGFDADNNGIGDITYRVDNLFGDLRTKYPNLDFFSGTLAATAIDMAGQAFPHLRPDPILTDSAPLIAPPNLPPISFEHNDSKKATSIITSAVLLTTGLAVIRRCRFDNERTADTRHS
ncbi:MAG: nitrous oxide reductase family maturation protein NosD [Acidimicrobiales bacterium]|nr:nitrous oxide reductase family maturation protein NosD [Acidimicrobiales bacterium]